MAVAVLDRFTRAMPVDPRGASGFALETVVPPAAMYGANGINVAPDGRVWICEALAQRISAYDPVTGALTTVVPMDGRVVGPDDLAFGPDGTAYVADYFRVTAVRPDGSTYTLCEGFEHANGITVDGEGRLFVNEFRMGGRLVEVDMNPPHAQRVILASTDLPNAFQRGPDGRLYVQNVMGGQIHAVDVDTGEKELVAEGLKRISAVKFSPAGRLVASQADLGVVTAIDLATGARETIARMPHRTIDNLTFAPDGTMYVSNYSTGCVLRVAPGGDPDGEVIIAPGLVAPSSLAAIDDATLLVGNLTTIVSVGMDGQFEEWSPWSPLSGEETVKVAIPIDRDSAHVLTGGGQVCLSHRGEAVATVKQAGPSRVIVDAGATAIAGSDGALYVALAGGEIRRVSRDGSAATLATAPQDRVTAMTVGDGVIVTADGAAGTVATLRDGATTTLDGFAAPAGLAIAGGGIFVAEPGARRVTRCDLDSGNRVVVAEDLALGSPVPGGRSLGSASLLARPDGSVLVGCDGDGSIRRIIGPR